MENQQSSLHVQKAVAFFRHAGLSHLMAKLREKYIEVGQVGGQILLSDSTPSERRDIASFLGKPLYPDVPIKIRLADVEKALRHSFDCSLPAVLRAYFPDQPLITRAEQRSMHAMYQADFRSALLSITTELPAASRGRLWLEHGSHGQAWLFSRYKNAPKEEQEQQLKQIRYIASILNQLPPADSPERLALFAQRTSGDPHALDANRATGRLFLLALSDLASSQQQEASDLPLSEHAEGTGPALFAEDSLSLSLVATPLGRTEELRLYADVALLVDTISSNVAVFNLAGATYHDGTADQLPQVAGERVLLLPLRQLLAWQSAIPQSTEIYVFENPQVFEEVVAALASARPIPTLVCTSGWPSMAGLTLLDLLLAASPDHHLHYSGDFDVKGLQIATYLMARYPGRCEPWHFDAPSYLHGLPSDGIAAHASELALLHTLPATFTALIATMQEQRKWAYQEGIVDLLIADIRRR